MHSATRRHRSRWPRAAGLVVCLLFALAACTREADREATPAEDLVVPVVARPAQTGSLRAVIHASGIITPAQGAEFLALAPEPARIQEIPRNQGDTVASGDVLVRFSMPTAADGVARQTAEVARTKAQLENARVSQARTRDFVERGLVARRELEGLDRELEEARTAVEQAERALQAAEAVAARAIVRAPFAGVIAMRMKNPGDVVQPVATDPVLRLVDPRRIEVTASVSAADTSRVLLGATARLAGPSGSTPVRLTVTTTQAPGMPGVGGTTPVRLVFAEPPPLAVDTPVEVDIDAEERSDVVFVPPEAIIGSGANAAVYVAVGNQAQRRTVTTGISDDERVEITSGVAAGDLVITRGQTNLPDGATISVDLGGR